MAIVVTGASGQFGRAAAELLIQKVPGRDLILTSRTPAKLKDLAAKGAQVRFADFDDKAMLVPAFTGGDRMLLISTARVGTRVGQHRNAIEAAVRAGVKHIVYTSTLGAAEPDNPAIVKRDHRATEEILEKSGVAWTFLRDSQYAEAIAEAVAPAAIMHGSLPGMSGDGRVAFVSRSDCVACAAAVLTTPGHEHKAYDLTGPELWTFPRAITRVAEIAGTTIPYILVNEEGMYAYFDAMGAPRHASDIVPDGPIPWSSEDMVSYEKSIRDGFFDVINNNVEKLTGHKPRGLEDVLQAAKAKWPPVKQ